MSKGFVALHRSIQDHWIFDNESYLRAWLIMLMTVNHQENKTLIKGKLLVCPRGQSVMSHSSWAKKFGKKWNRNKVIRFFKLLESDQMIEQVNEQVTTRVTICNYSQYQDLRKSERTGKRTGDDTPSAHQAHTKRTGDGTQLNHDNHVNNDNQGGSSEPPAPKVAKFDSEKHFDEFWSHYPARDGSKGSKKNSMAKFKRECKSPEDFALIMSSLDDHIAVWKDPKYIPMATTWLNGECWNDDVTKPKESNDLTKLSNDQLFKMSEGMSIHTQGLSRNDLISAIQGKMQ